MKKSIFNMNREIKELYFIPFYKVNNMKRISFYNAVLKDRVFDREMSLYLTGIKEPYGVSKIRLKRKYKSFQ